MPVTQQSLSVFLKQWIFLEHDNKLPGKFHRVTPLCERHINFKLMSVKCLQIWLYLIALIGLY